MYGLPKRCPIIDDDSMIILIILSQSMNSHHHKIPYFVLGLSYAFRVGGMPLGLILLICCGLTTGRTEHLIKMSFDIKCDPDHFSFLHSVGVDDS